MKMKIANKKITARIGIFVASSLFVASAIYFYSPTISSHAAGSESKTARVNLTINTSASLSLDVNHLLFDIAPTVSGVFESKAIVATASTNSTAGYELYFSSENEETAMTSLTTESTIASDFSGAVTSSTMAKNKWGYSLDNTNFSKIPVASAQTKIRTIDHTPTSSEKDTTVNIATKINTELPSGTYSKRVIFSLIAREAPQHISTEGTIYSITKMQEMTPEICAATFTPSASATNLDWTGQYHGDENYVPRVKLQDTRDDKYYTVSKLADGNCWMNQNLDLALTANTALRNTTTDLNTKTSWTPKVTTIASPVAVKSYGGYYVGNKSLNWGNTNQAASSKDWSWRKADGKSYMRDGTKSMGIPREDDSDEYLWETIGTFYNWYAATAGTGLYSTSANTSVNNSICPKGWRLPTSTGEKSYDNLLTTVYGATSASVLSAPLNFMRSGYIRWDADQDEDTGNYIGGASGVESNGVFWTATANSQDNAYRLLVNSTRVNGKANMAKGNAMPIRCVAR